MPSSSNTQSLNSQNRFSLFKLKLKLKLKHMLATSLLFVYELLATVRAVQLRSLANNVVERMRSERMPQAASSLAFTTLLALVPLVTVALSLFAMFPAFENLRAALEDYFIESLMPKPVASVVTQYLMQFSNKARGLSLMGACFLLVSAVSLFASIERTLNGLWHAPTPKLLNHRWLIYLAALLLAPFLIGIGFYLVVQLFTSLRGLSHAFGVVSAPSLQGLAILLATSVWAAVFKHVPNTAVRWSHAWLGAIVSSGLLWLLKYLFVAYILKFGNFKQLYGAFSVLPVFLLWIYVSWLATLFGATVSACLPVVETATFEQAINLEIASIIDEAHTETANTVLADPAPIYPSPFKN
jgi:membrane protein